MMLHWIAKIEEELVDRAKPFVWRLVAANVPADGTLPRAGHFTEEQRNRYAQIKQAQDNRQMDVVEQMMPGRRRRLSALPVSRKYRKIADDFDEPTGALLSRGLLLRAPILRFRTARTLPITLRQ